MKHKQFRKRRREADPGEEQRTRTNQGGERVLKRVPKTPRIELLLILLVATNLKYYY